MSEIPHTYVDMRMRTRSRVPTRVTSDFIQFSVYGIQRYNTTKRWVPHSLDALLTFLPYPSIQQHVKMRHRPLHTLRAETASASASALATASASALVRPPVARATAAEGSGSAAPRATAPRRAWAPHCRERPTLSWASTACDATARTAALHPARASGSDSR